MKKQILIVLAAGLLIAGVSAASAAEMKTSNAQMSPPAAKDTLSLSATQQKTAWNDLNGEAAKQKAPPSFFRAVGDVVPGSVNLQPMPAKAASDVPALQPYKFAKIESKLLIVNPSDRKIAEVITR